MKLKNYDPARATNKATFQYAAFTFNNDKVGERTVLIDSRKLDGKRPDEVRAHVQRLYEVFRRAEEYAEAQKYGYTDKVALERATQLYGGVNFIIAANCYSVYTARLEEDTEEARAEQAYLDGLNEKIDVNEHIAEALEKSAEVLCKQWLEDNGPEHARGLVRAADFHLTKQLVAAAILGADEEVPLDAPDEVWRAAFDRLYKAQVEKGAASVFEDYMQHEAADILENDIKPVERSLEELRGWAGIFYLSVKAEGGGVSDHAEVQAASMEIRPRTPEHIWALSMMPAQTVDRAARGFGGWAFPIGDAPVFEDANNKHAVTYFADGVPPEALREGVMQLNPRTADVWRLCTAAILESWGEGEREPPRVWLDARQLCDTMGFKKHHKGGHHPKNVAIAARALVDLERFYITIPYGTKEYPVDPRTGKRKATRVEAQRRDKVLIMTGSEGMKFLFDDEYLPVRWKVTAGDWIKAYPRAQFARLFRALVELPGTYTPDLWAKALGTELVWQYRQDEGKTQTQRVETMLRQACVLDEARREKNKGRARDNFEKAMDALQKRGVCTGWEYNGDDIDRVEATQKGWFNLWLQTRVTVKPPPEVTKVLQGVAKTKKQHRRRVKKA